MLTPPITRAMTSLRSSNDGAFTLSRSLIPYLRKGSINRKLNQDEWDAQGFVVQADSQVAMLNELVHAKHHVVRL